MVDRTGTITEVSTPTANVAHALSGHNPTLFNVVLQYADMDMLRALAVTSHSLYVVLQHCRFDHLTMVVLEAPIMEEQQLVVYNGANPVPADALTTSTPRPSQKIPGCTPTDYQAFDNWRQRADVRGNFNHNLIIPDYARNFMACARSVELVVYCRRLGTRISTFFTTNAHHIKHGRPTTFCECALCAESASVNTQHKLHLACSPSLRAQHCTTDDGYAHGDNNSNASSPPNNGCIFSKYRSHAHGDNNSKARSPPNNGCIFSKHRSHEHVEGDGAESRLSRFYETTFRPKHLSGNFPYQDLPSLRLKNQHNTPGAGLEGHSTIKRKRHNCDTFYRDGHFCIAASEQNMSVSRPHFKNLPLAEQRSLTTSLHIRMVDHVSFDVEDWCNAIPGCVIQPVQTWTIQYYPNSHPADCETPFVVLPETRLDIIHSDGNDDIGHHFPRLTSLVLHYTSLNESNVCGIDDFGMRDYVRYAEHAELSHFFIRGDLIRLPHLQHFGVIGTILDYLQYAKTVFCNAHVSSLNINPGPQTNVNGSNMIRWIPLLTDALDRLEDTTLPPYTTLADDIRKARDAKYCAIPAVEDLEQDYPHREPPPQPWCGSMQQVENTEVRHKPRLRRKYNFSLDFAKSYSESRCPHDVDATTRGVPVPDACGHVIPPYEDPSHFGQHWMSCASIHSALVGLYVADIFKNTEDRFKFDMSWSDWPDVLPAGIKDGDVMAIFSIARLAQRTLTHLELRCHYCSHASPGFTPFPGASPGDCTATHLPPSANVPLDITGSPQNEADEEMYMRLRELLRIPEHVVLRL